MSLSAPPSPPQPDAGAPRGALAIADLMAGLVALAGVALLFLVATRYRLDRTLCAAWPARSTGFGYALVYLAGLGALVFAWRRVRGYAVPLLVHAFALFAAPFLSSDPLMYAAVGRALASGAQASTPLFTALGASHPFLEGLPPAWQRGTSAYGPAWNALASVLASVAGDDLALALRLHQGVALVALLLGAAILASRYGARGFVLVALCPLAIIEATIGAHNDALLIPLVAGALVAWLGGRGLACVVLLALGLAIKASAGILLLPAILTMVLATIVNSGRRRAVLASFVMCGIAALAVLPTLHDGPLDALSRLVERPDVAYDHCTRSLECLPRVVFRFVLHMPTAAWATGLVFRALGILWLGWCCLRAAEAYRQSADRAQPVIWLARGLFVYFLVLHGWAQSWYLLPLLPTLPVLSEDWSDRGIRVYLVAAVAYYALVLPMSCLGDPLSIAVSDLAEASITFFPPVVILLRTARKNR